MLPAGARIEGPVGPRNSSLNIKLKLKYHDDGILCSHLAVQICSARTEHRYVLSLQKLINWDGNIVEAQSVLAEM